ncbi:MAG: glycosyltransferase family 4 protein [Caldilineaceae bacterium]
MPKKIAFVKIGSFSHANEFLATALRNQFPHHELEVFDVWKLAREHKGFFTRNLPYVAKEYGLDLLLKRRKFSQCMTRTTYIFREFSKLAAQQINQCDHAFSFQTQTMFDASREGVKHFVYTDHTALANLHYPSLSKQERQAALVSNRWIQQERAIYQHAAVNFPMSQFIARSMIEDYGCPHEKVVCVYAGGNLAYQSEPTPKNYASKTIIFVGVEWERKGGPELAKAFALVRQTHPDANLIVVGCTPQISLPNCRIVGKVPVQSIRQYYDQASIFCLPTRREPFGFVFVEAMLEKLPVVATRIGAVPDLISEGETGCIVEPGDVQGLATVLTKLLGDPTRCQAMGEAGHRRAKEEFSWDKVAQRIKEQVTTVVPNL